MRSHRLVTAVAAALTLAACSGTTGPGTTPSGTTASTAPSSGIGTPTTASPGATGQSGTTGRVDSPGQGAAALARHVSLPPQLRAAGWREVAQPDLRPGEIGARWAYGPADAPVCGVAVKVLGGTATSLAGLGASAAQELRSTPGVRVVRDSTGLGPTHLDEVVELTGTDPTTGGTSLSSFAVRHSGKGTMLMALGSAQEAAASSCQVADIVSGARLTGVEHPDAAP